jgi:hypothetical protein
LLAWKLCGEIGVVGGVVILGSSVGLGVYWREEGEETMNTSKQMQHGCMAWQYAMLVVT